MRSWISSLNPLKFRYINSRIESPVGASKVIYTLGSNSCRKSRRRSKHWVASYVTGHVRIQDWSVATGKMRVWKTILLGFSWALSWRCLKRPWRRVWTGSRNQVVKISHFIERALSPYPSLSILPSWIQIAQGFEKLIRIKTLHPIHNACVRQTRLRNSWTEWVRIAELRSKPI